MMQTEKPEEEEEEASVEAVEVRRKPGKPLEPYTGNSSDDDEETEKQNRLAFQRELEEIGRKLKASREAKSLERKKREAEKSLTLTVDSSDEEEFQASIGENGEVTQSSTRVNIGEAHRKPPHWQTHFPDNVDDQRLSLIHI